jgi:alanine-glyoxylate transaminase/serine-glyoxylate transaminase/serine-pyruvate transaminase
VPQGYWINAADASSMTLRAGREFLSIPGPTVIPDAVLAAMQKPAVDIYSGPLVATTRRHEQDVPH